MLSMFTGNTVSDSYGLHNGGIHLPRYPHFRHNSRHFSSTYYYRRSERYLDCQSARFVLVGGELITLIGSCAIDPALDLGSWWRGYFHEHFNHQRGEVIKFTRREELHNFLRDHPDSRIVAPHPYGGTANNFYLRDPAILVRLNDKGRMRELSSHTIPYDTYTPNAFARDDWKNHWRLPFVVKLTEPSGGGDGVIICLTDADITLAKRRFAGRKIKIEQYIDNPANNYNINLHVSQSGEISFIGGSLQHVSAEGKYTGNYIDLNWQPPQALETLCTEVAHNAWRTGWHGVCGLDILEDRDATLYFMDPNFRLNGSTPFYFLREYFATHYRQALLETGYYTWPGEPETFLDTFKTEIERKMLAPIGLYFDPQHDGHTRIYAAIAAEGDHEHIAFLKRKMAEKQLRPGINL